MVQKLDELFYASNATFLEELFEKYLINNNSVDESWQKFFKKFSGIANNYPKTTSKIIQNDPSLKEVQKKSSLQQHVYDQNISLTQLKWKILEYFRNVGGVFSNINPLSTNKKVFSIKNILDQLSIDAKLLRLEIDFFSQSISVEKLIHKLENVYCRKISTEFSHVEDYAERNWLFEEFEQYATIYNNLPEEKTRYLDKAINIKSFEQYINTKFPAAKRFSIEGGEAALISANRAIEIFATSGVKSCIMGMAHRGRLSLLTSIMGKKERHLFSEFLKEPDIIKDLGISSDVKYHLGFSSKQNVEGNEIELYLASNPSHLEAVNPVVYGNIRSLQDKLASDLKFQISGILIHGDASFVGQGVVYETIMSSKLPQYDVGGLIHIIINNQIGYTTNHYELISGKYCSNLSKANGIPVLHVNGEHMESVLLATEFACKYKLKFKKDIIIDLVCYRKYGHNEGDEPSYTQPLMYKIIQQKQDLSRIYNQELVQEKIIDEKYYDSKQSEIKQYLDNEFDNVGSDQVLSDIFGYRVEEDLVKFDNYNRKLNIISTSVSDEQFSLLSSKIAQIPVGFHMHPKLQILFRKKHELLSQGKLDWSIAEYMAFGSLLLEKINIRMIGQDTERGTFAHRHAVLHDCTNGTKFTNLENLDSKQGFFNIYNSNLSEYAALGFEFGYSLFNHQDLVIWEAQYGDFFNGAQIIFDQFISSSEQKWLNMSGLVVLLPHGFEGQGPEHSSARIERFLTLAAEDNIQIIYPTTPANLFHILRLQVKRVNKKPLVMLAPKSLLRNKISFSSKEEILGNNRFKTIIETKFVKTSQIKHILFCSGKIYYEILKQIKDRSFNDVSIVRLEQIYPLDQVALQNILKLYPNSVSLTWIQEEPKNMGCWIFMQNKLNEIFQNLNFKNKLKYIGRKESASPATGYLNVHNIEQQAILNQMLSILQN